MSILVPDNILEILRAPLPDGAVKRNKSKPKLSAINATFCIEVFNNAFGLGGWFIKNEVIERYPQTLMDSNGDKYNRIMIVVKATMTVPEYGIERESFGGNNNEDLGDAYKGACTDALTKIAASIFVGMDVFKGLHDGDADTEDDKPWTTRSKEAATKVGEEKLAKLRAADNKPADAAALHDQVRSMILRAHPGTDDRTKSLQSDMLERMFGTRSFVEVKAMPIERLRAAIAAAEQEKLLSDSVGLQQLFKEWQFEPELSRLAMNVAAKRVLSADDMRSLAGGALPKVRRDDAYAFLEMYMVSPSAIQILAWPPPARNHCATIKTWLRAAGKKELEDATEAEVTAMIEKYAKRPETKEDEIPF